MSMQPEKVQRAIDKMVEWGYDQGHKNSNCFCFFFHQEKKCGGDEVKDVWERTGKADLSGDLSWFSFNKLKTWIIKPEYPLGEGKWISQSFKEALKKRNRPLKCILVEMYNLGKTKLW